MTDDLATGGTAGYPVSLAGPPLSPSMQLAQVRVPLDQAAEAFASADATGRLPIVILPMKASRVRTEFVAAGVLAAGVGLLLNADLILRTVLIAIGVVLVVVGVFRAFLVPVPEGAQAVLLRHGRFSRTLGPGNHVLSPTVIVSHLVTTRETPFDAPATEIPTADDVRTNVDILMTFRITEPEKFVFKISAPDFDQVCQATCQEAVRLLFRGKKLDEVLDVGAEAGGVLGTQIGAALAQYGIEVVRVVVTQIKPPREFMAALESRRLAAVQRAEELEQHELKALRQSDREELERQQISARQQLIELEAANEVSRLERLETRIRDYPNAMRWDVEHDRLAVARALASNTRAMVQVGPGLDVASSLLFHTSSNEATPAGAPTTPAVDGAAESHGPITSGEAEPGQDTRA